MYARTRCPVQASLWERSRPGAEVSSGPLFASTVGRQSELYSNLLSVLLMKDSAQRSGRSPDWLKMESSSAFAVKRGAEEGWGKKETENNELGPPRAFLLDTPKWRLPWTASNRR